LQEVRGFNKQTADYEEVLKKLKQELKAMFNQEEIYMIYDEINQI